MDSQYNKAGHVYLQFGESGEVRECPVRNLGYHVVTQISEMDDMQYSTD